MTGHPCRGDFTRSPHVPTRVIVGACSAAPHRFRALWIPQPNGRLGPGLQLWLQAFPGASRIIGLDWGVCSNLQSPRAGLLTFEHMGCRLFEEGEEPAET